MNLNRASIFVAVLMGLTVGLTPAFGFDICGDGICNANAFPFGETQLTCPQDCTTVGDADLDTIPDTSDNCPFHDNVNQEDCDQDGLGDICDPDDAVWEVVELNRE